MASCIKCQKIKEDEVKVVPNISSNTEVGCDLYMSNFTGKNGRQIIRTEERTVILVNKEHWTQWLFLLPFITSLKEQKR